MQPLTTGNMHAAYSCKPDPPSCINDYNPLAICQPYWSQQGIFQVFPVPALPTPAAPIFASKSLGHPGATLKIRRWSLQPFPSYKRIYKQTYSSQITNQPSCWETTFWSVWHSLSLSADYSPLTIAVLKLNKEFIWQFRCTWYIEKIVEKQWVGHKDECFSYCMLQRRWHWRLKAYGSCWCLKWGVTEAFRRLLQVCWKDKIADDSTWD